MSSAVRPAGSRAGWLVLVLWSAACFAVLAHHGGISWHFFVTGSRLLFSGSYDGFHKPGGLTLYQNYPILQIGPLAMLAAEILHYLGPDQGLVAAEVVMTLIGLGVIWVLVMMVGELRPELTGTTRQVWLLVVGGVVFMTGWEELAAAYAHLDDALTIGFVVLALRAASRSRPVATGIFLGLATDAKPWALGAGAILVVVACIGNAEDGRFEVGLRHFDLRRAVLVVAAYAVVVAAAWLPFYFGGDHLTAFRHFTILNLAQSPLRFIGVNNARTPSWDRDTQIAVGVILGLIAIGRRRWVAVLFLATMARVALDPATHSYYSCGPLAGALALDLLDLDLPVPALTITTFVALNVVPPIAGISSPAVGGARFILASIATLAVAIVPAKAWRSPATPSRMAEIVKAGGREIGAHGG